MLDIDSTINEYGYNPINLSKGSNKKICVICDYCKVKYTINNSKHHRTINSTITKHCCNECTPKKRKEVFQKLYGVDKAVDIPGVKERIKKTNLERYGCEIPSQNPEVQAKATKTILDRYGKKPIEIANEGLEAKFGKGFRKMLASPDIRQKAKNTIKNKYGVENIGAVPEIRAKIRATNIARYGKPNAIAKYGKEEKELLELLNSNGFNFSRYKSLSNNKEIDLFDESIMVGIEYCGVYWHSELYLDKNYHFNKFKQAKSEGIRLITIFADTWLENKEWMLNKLLVSLLQDKSKNYDIDQIQHMNGNIILDNLWANFRKYESVGFKFIEYIEPDYWIMPDKNARRKINKWEAIDPNNQIKVWDCGKSIYYKYSV